MYIVQQGIKTAAMGHEDWSIEEQEEVKKFFKINNLESELWPKVNDFSNSALIDEADNSDGEIEAKSNSAATLHALSNSSFVNENLTMTGSMADAKNLLDEVRDPLGISDSLYQMQVQRILMDPKYNQPLISDSIPPSILLSSPNFDARLCLRLVHQYTSYEDLIRACEQLGAGIEARRGVLKLLVRENFDRFVNAKNSIDAVYADMRGKGMNSGDFGMRPTTASVNAALEKSQQVYHPLLKRRSREECIRKRLAIFQEYKAIFNLPAALHQHIKLGEFQQCVYAYRRGRELLIAEPSYSGLKPILEKVWELQVEKAASGLRNVLFEKLNNPVFPFDVQSKIVGYLLELEASPDPIIFYFNTKSSHIMRQCQIFQDEAVKAIEVNLAQPKASQLEDHVVALLRDTLKVLESRVYEQFTDLSYPTVREWKIIAEAFNQLSGNLKSILLPVAKMTSQIFDMKLSRINQQLLKEVYPRKLEECIKLIVDSLQNNVDSVFSSVMGQSGHVDNSAVGMFFTLRIVRQLGETFASILDASPHAIMMDSLKSSFAYIINTLLSRIWMTAVVDCRNMGLIEDWKLNSSPSTALVKSFENLLTFLLIATISCRKIFFEVVQDGVTFIPLEGVDQWFIKAFTEFVIEGMYKYVRPSKSESSNDPAILGTNGLSADLEILDFIGRDDSIDLLKLNLPARLLVIISNVSYLQIEGLRNLLNIFGHENIRISPNSIVSTLANVERAVTQLFLQDQVGRIIGPIESSWLIETSNRTNDVSLSTAVYKSLLSLADVQSLISDISPKDPLPLLRDLANTFITKMLQILKEKPLLKTDQVIQAKIDLEFLKRKFEDSSLMTPESVELIKKIDSILMASEKIDDFPSIWSKFESNWHGPFSNLFSF